MKHYINEQTHETTRKVTVAMGWYRKGCNLKVYDDKYHYIVKINGAATTNNQDDKNYNHCKGIANTVRDYANGRYYACPDCGETIYTSENWLGEKYKCPNCGEVINYYDLRPLTLWDYFDDVFDIEYRIGSNKEYRSVRVMVACGGPNIYIDTASKNVGLYWWTESAHYPLDYDTVEEIDNYFEELFNC